MVSIFPSHSGSGQRLPGFLPLTQAASVNPLHSNCYAADMLITKINTSFEVVVHKRRLVGLVYMYYICDGQLTSILQPLQPFTNSYPDLWFPSADK
jgi:hypothetical protein